MSDYKQIIYDLVTKSVADNGEGILSNKNLFMQNVETILTDNEELNLFFNILFDEPLIMEELIKATKKQDTLQNKIVGRISQVVKYYYSIDQSEYSGVY